MGQPLKNLSKEGKITLTDSIGNSLVPTKYKALKNHLDTSKSAPSLHVGGPGMKDLLTSIDDIHKLSYYSYLLHCIQLSTTCDESENLELYVQVSKETRNTFEKYSHVQRLSPEVKNNYHSWNLEETRFFDYAYYSFLDAYTSALAGSFPTKNKEEFVLKKKNLEQYITLSF